MMSASAGWAHRPRSTPFARVEQISPRVWLVVEDDRFNEHPFLYVIIGESRIVLIDTGVGTNGTGSYAKWLRQWLAEANPHITQRPLLVVNTHCHFDHVGGNAGLAPLAEAICASGHDCGFTKALLDPQRDASLASEVGCQELQPYDVTRWLADGENIPLADADESDVLSVLHTPGHTPDSLMLWLERERILFTGDTIYPYSFIIVSNRDSDVDAFAASLDRAIAFVCSRCCAPDGTSEGGGAEDVEASGLQSVRLACGHIAHDLAFSALEELRDLVRDATAGQIAPIGPKQHRAGRGKTSFERDTLSILIRDDDPVLAATLAATRSTGSQGSAATVAPLRESAGE